MPPISRRTVLKWSAAGAFAPSLLAAGATHVRAADVYADAKFIDGAPPMPQAGSFTIAVLPDTQNYSERFPDHFVAQTTWIKEQQAARNIACVLHLGDITNRNTPEQWENAVRGMNVLDGVVPYFMAPGNHDYSEGGSCKDRTTHLNEYFPKSKFAARPEFGGVYDKEPEQMENSYHTFSVRDRKFLVLALEFGPRADVVRWANEVVGKHHDHEAILITHAYIYYDETRYNWAKFGEKQTWNPHDYGVAKNSGDDVNDGEELWDKLISKHENFILTLNGHVLDDGLGRVVTTTPGGRAIEQLLVNFQMKPNGGDGWLRLLEFHADGTRVQTYDYSPTLNRVNASAQNQFEFKVAPLA